jgi:hypothetical protein
VHDAEIPTPGAGEVLIETHYLTMDAALRLIMRNSSDFLFRLGPGDLVRWRRVEACARTGWEFLWVYRLKHAGPFVLHPEEIERGEWVVPAELTARMREQPAEFTPAFRLIWEQIGAEAGG